MFITSISSESVGTNYNYGNSTSSNNEVHIQFVQGHVTDVITNETHPLYEEFQGSGGNGDLYINAIKAKKHINSSSEDSINLIGDSSFGDNNIDPMVGEIYFPLLRGIVDVPTQGDPVLLCKFGGVNYYLGPLNTSNSPNFNPDFELKNPPSGEINFMDKYNISPGLSYHPNNVRRMRKPGLDSLDTINTSEEMKHPELYGVGDMVLEGRQGNSIRIGQRSEFPYIVISNGRWNAEGQESIYDDTFISITSNGTIENNYGIELDLSTQNSKNDRPIPLKTDDDPSGWGEYNGPHLLMRSNKITLDSRFEPMTFASANAILLGSGTDLKIYTNNSTIIESSNIYLGEGAKEQDEPLVLGNELVAILEKLIDNIGQIFVAGTIGGTSVPANASGSPGWTQLTTLKTQLNNILSKYHYIETNTTQKGQ